MPLIQLVGIDLILNCLLKMSIIEGKASTFKEDPHMAKKILVVDDEKPISDIVKFNLTKEGYEVYTAYDGEEALQQVEEAVPDLILLDLMLPKIDGLEVARQVRKSHDMPIIMVTAKDSEIDKVIGLELGADDYVTKPFNPVELLARVKSQLRRYMQLGAAPVKKNILKIGDIELDDMAKEVTMMGEKVNLTPKEYGILKFLMENPGRVFSPVEIYNKVWDDTAFGAEGTVAVHIRHLREKTEINPEQPRHLKVVWGQGYKIE
mgnify:CR=1 FL=1